MKNYDLVFSISHIEWLGVLLALLYLILAIYEKRLCWLAAILSSICYIVVFAQSELYTESALQIFFIILAVRGFYYWDYSKANANVLQIKNLEIHNHLFGIATTLLFSLLLGYTVSIYSSASYIYVDSAITCFSIYTTWLTTEKYLENWLYWIVIDVIAAYLYFVKGLYPTAILFVLYTILAVVGYLKWKKNSLIIK